MERQFSVVNIEQDEPPFRPSKLVRPSVLVPRFSEYVEDRDAVAAAIFSNTNGGDSLQSDVLVKYTFPLMFDENKDGLETRFAVAFRYFLLVRPEALWVKILRSLQAEDVSCPLLTAPDRNKKAYQTVEALWVKGKDGRISLCASASSGVLSPQAAFSYWTNLLFCLAGWTDMYTHTQKGLTANTVQWKEKLPGVYSYNSLIQFFFCRDEEKGATHRQAPQGLAQEGPKENPPSGQRPPRHLSHERLHEEEHFRCDRAAPGKVLP